jgi:hypothetical protein
MITLRAGFMGFFYATDEPVAPPWSPPMPALTRSLVAIRAGQYVCAVLERDGRRSRTPWYPDDLLLIESIRYKRGLGWKPLYRLRATLRRPYMAPETPRRL